MRRHTLLLVLILAFLLSSCQPVTLPSSATEASTSLPAEPQIILPPAVASPLPSDAPLPFVAPTRENLAGDDALRWTHLAALRPLDGKEEYQRRFYAPNGVDYFECMVRFPYEFSFVSFYPRIIIEGRELDYEPSWSAVPSWLNDEEIWCGELVYHFPSDSFYPADVPDDLRLDALPLFAVPSRDGARIFYAYERYHNISGIPEDGLGRLLLYLRDTASGAWHRIPAIFETTYNLHIDLLNAVWSDAGILYFSVGAGGGDGPFDPKTLFRYDPDLGEVSILHQGAYILPYRSYSDQYLLINAVAKTLVLDMESEAFIPLPDELYNMHWVFFSADHGSLFALRVESSIVLWDCVTQSMVACFDYSVLGDKIGSCRLEYRHPYFVAYFLDDIYLSKAYGLSLRYAVIPDVFDPLLNPPHFARLSTSAPLLQEAFVGAHQLRLLPAESVIAIYAKAVFRDTSEDASSFPFYLVCDDEGTIGWLQADLAEELQQDLCLVNPMQTDASAEQVRGEVYHTETFVSPIESPGKKPHRLELRYLPNTYEYYLDDEKDALTGAAYACYMKNDRLLSPLPLWLGPEEVVLNSRLRFNLNTREGSSFLPPDVPEGRVLFASPHGTVQGGSFFFLLYEAAMPNGEGKYLLYHFDPETEQWQLIAEPKQAWEEGYGWGSSLGYQDEKTSTGLYLYFRAMDESDSEQDGVSMQRFTAENLLYLVVFGAEGVQVEILD